MILQGKLEDAFSLYEQAIAIEKGKEHSQTLPMLFAQYSRFVYLVGLSAYLYSSLVMQSCLSQTFPHLAIEHETGTVLLINISYCFC